MKKWYFYSESCNLNSIYIPGNSKQIICYGCDNACFVFHLVYLGFFVPLEIFSLIWRRHHCRWRAANFDLISALKAIEQWGFFCVPHLLWHGASVYNGHLQGPVTHLLPCVWQWSCHYLCLRLRSVAAGIRKPKLPLARRTDLVVFQLDKWSFILQRDSTIPPPWRKMWPFISTYLKSLYPRLLRAKLSWNRPSGSWTEDFLKSSMYMYFPYVAIISPLKNAWTLKGTNFNSL